MKEKYHLGAVDRAEWLDSASLSRADQLIAALADPTQLRAHRAYQSEAEGVEDEDRLPWEGDPLGAGGAAFLVVADYEMEEDNPVEQKYRKLAHDQLRGLVDPELKPNLDERQRIDAIVSSRALGDQLRMEEKDLLWRFRYCLTDDKKAITRFLLSVDWGVESEVAQVPGLLEQWRERAPIDVSDALRLLGRERTYQAEVVRRFAVDALRRASDEELLAFLLQLRSVSPLAWFLIDRARNSLELANFLYWYLRVDLEDATHGAMYRGVLAAFRGAMRQEPHSAKVMADMLHAQDEYIQSVSWAHRQACAEKGRKSQKDEKLRELLQLPNIRRVPRQGRGGEGGKVPMPLDPTMQITGLEPNSAFMFRSALYPCVVTFTVKAREGGGGKPAATSPRRGKAEEADPFSSSAPGKEEEGGGGAGQGSVSGSGWMGHGRSKETTYKAGRRLGGGAAGGIQG
ncbi:unnamed protein product [Discosporangium mesarthrocarpum]